MLALSPVPKVRLFRFREGENGTSRVVGNYRNGVQTAFPVERGLELIKMESSGKIPCHSTSHSIPTWHLQCHILGNRVYIMFLFHIKNNRF